MPRRVRRLSAALGAALLLASLLLSVATVTARLTGHQVLVLTSGSMEPRYSAGDALLIRTLTDADLTPGTVITYRAPNGTLTTHRIASLRTIRGQNYVQTKGDANAAPDPDFTPVANIVGSPVADLPHGGKAAWLFTHPHGRVLLFAPPLLLLLISEARKLRTALRGTCHPGPAVPRARRDSTRTVIARHPRIAAAVAAVVATAAVTTACSLTLAGYAATGTVPANQFTAATLTAPDGLAATRASGATRLTWNPTGSDFADGYQILRSTGGDYVVAASVPGRAATTWTDPTAPPPAAYTVRATAAAWTSPASAAVTAAPGAPVTTGWAACTTNTAVSSGKGNGYETDPAGACTADGSGAVDADGGTSRDADCANPAKDRHQFGGYQLGIPASAAITGIEVRTIGSLNRDGGGLCIELSGDGGVTWTTPKYAPYTTRSTQTLTFGGTTDLWGTTWSPQHLAPDGLLVRVTNVFTANNGNNRFTLDHVGVRVTYR